MYCSVSAISYPVHNGMNGYVCSKAWHAVDDVVAMEVLAVVVVVAGDTTS